MKHSAIAAFAILFACSVAVPLAPAAGMGSDTPASTSASSQPGYQEAEKLIKEEKWEPAITALNALNLPDDPDVLNLLGYCHRKTGKIDEGIVFYTKALEKNKEHKGAYEYLGEAYLQKNDLPKAEEQLVKLKDVCGFFGCTEATELSDAIEAFKKAKQGS